MLDDLVDIPEFLIRQKHRGRPRKVPQSVVVDTEKQLAEKYASWRAIKEKSYGTHHDMYLTNELPRFGCGYRSFYVKEGRKWAKFTKHLGDPADTTGRMRGQLSMAHWNAMKKLHEQYLKRNDPDAVAKRKSINRHKTISNYA